MAIYAILIFVIVALEDLMDETEFEKVSGVLSWIELGILLIFILEIFMGLYAWGVRVYILNYYLEIL